MGYKVLWFVRFMVLLRVAVVCIEVFFRGWQLDGQLRFGPMRGEIWTLTKLQWFMTGNGDVMMVINWTLSFGNLLFGAFLNMGQLNDSRWNKVVVVMMVNIVETLQR